MHRPLDPSLQAASRKMCRRQAWLIRCLSGFLLACSGCAQLPTALHERGPDLSPAGGSRLEMAQMSERLGRADLAEKFYHDVLVVQPDHPVAHHRLAALASRAGRWREADEHFRLARRGGPPSADLLTDIAYAQYQRGQVRAAEHTLRQALEADAQHAKSRSLLALVLSEQGRFREGLAQFRQAVRGIEHRGGAPEAYGATLAAGSTPAPRPSAQRTEVELAAAGVRAAISPGSSPVASANDADDSPEDADDRRLARDESPSSSLGLDGRLTRRPVSDDGPKLPAPADLRAEDRVAVKEASSPDADARPAMPVLSEESPKPAEPAAGGEVDRVADEKALRQSRRTAESLASPIDLLSASKRSREPSAKQAVAHEGTSPEGSAARQPAARSTPERGVVVRIGASSLKELPTRCTTQGTALRASPPGDTEHAADNPPKARLQFKRAEKHLGPRQATFEEPAATNDESGRP